MSVNLTEKNFDTSIKLEEIQTPTKMEISTSHETSTNLHLAAKENDLEKLKEALEQLKIEGGDIDQQDQSGNTALSLAVQNKDKKENLELIVQLIQHGANINHNLGLEQNPIWQACRTGNLEAIQYFISYNQENVDLEYCMYAALCQGQVEITKYLKPFLEDTLWTINGCLDKEGNTAAHIAAKTDNLAMLQYLREEGADFNVILKENGLELNVLMTAVKYGSTSILTYLHQCNYSFKHEDNPQNDAVLLAVRYDQRASLSFLFDINIQLSVEIPFKKYTLFLYAANMGYVDIMDFLLEKDKNVIHERDSEGNNALLIATEKGHMHVIEFLRKRFGLTQLNIANNFGQNAYAVTIQFKRSEILKYFIRYGLVIKNLSQSLSDALSNRNSHDFPNDECVIILHAIVRLQSICKCNTKHDTSIKNLITDINNALSQGASVNQRDAKNSSPLHLAAANGHEIVFQTLVEHVVKQFKQRSGILRCKDGNGKNPLQLAQENGHLSLASNFYFEYLQELVQANQLSKIPEVYKEAIEVLFIPLNKINSGNVTQIIDTTSLEEMIDKNIKNIFSFWEKTNSLPGIELSSLFDRIFKFLAQLSNAKGSGFLVYYNDECLKYLKTRTYIHLARVFNNYCLNVETVQALTLVLSITEKTDDIKISRNRKFCEDAKREAHAMLGELCCTGRVNSLNNEIRTEEQIIQTMLKKKDSKDLEGSQGSKSLKGLEGVEGLEDNGEESVTKNKAENDSNIALGLLHFCQAGTDNPAVVDSRRIWTNRFRNKTMSNFGLGDPLNPKDLVDILKDANTVEAEANNKIAKMEIELQHVNKKAHSNEQELNSTKQELQTTKMELDETRKKLEELEQDYQNMMQNTNERNNKNEPKLKVHGTKRNHAEMLNASQLPETSASKKQRLS